MFSADIDVLCNLDVQLREHGKIRERRELHNVFTVTGKNWLSKLVGWKAIGGGGDTPYTQRRVRWVGVGSGTQIESSTVSYIQTPVLVNSTDYLSPIQSVEFPTSTSVRFIREFAANEISLTSTPVIVTEAGLFADVDPAGDGYEDSPVGGSVTSILDPGQATNPPVAYATFEALTKTINFTLTVRWEFRF